STARRRSTPAGRRRPRSTDARAAWPFIRRRARRSSVQRLATGEPLVEPVPEGDLGLADLPAEKNLLLPAPCGKVEQPLVEILDLHAGVVEPANAVGNPVDLAGDLLGRIAHLARREIASVARDLRDELCLANLCSGERASVRDHALGERAQLDECLVRLVRREE